MHTLRAYWVRTIVVLYLLVVLVLAGSLALQTWPDNPLRQRLYVREAERIAALHVTDESIVALSRALVILSNLPEADIAKRPSRADLAFLSTQLAFAENIQQKAGKRDPNPARWDRSIVQSAADTLTAARQSLEQRAVALVPTTLESKPTVILRRVFAAPAPLTFTPVLTNSEQARVSLLLSERSRPPSDTSPASAFDQKLRPVFAQLQDTDFILLVIALGAWGAAAQALASVSDYFGAGRYSDRWAVFYFTRPPIGATLAFTFYVVFRGGLLNQNGSWEEINHVGYAAISVLVGFFSNEALANLKRIATGIFADKEDSDGLKAKLPLVSGIKWIVTPATDWLEITGSNFNPTTQVFVNGVAATQGIKVTGTTTITCDALLLKLKPGDLLQLLDTGAGAKLSTPHQVPAAPLEPALTSAQLDAAKTTLTLTGRRFPAKPTVAINGMTNSTSFTSASSTSITLALVGWAPPINIGAKVCVFDPNTTVTPSNVVSAT